MAVHCLHQKIMSSMRAPAYGISVAAFAWFFLIPQPFVALSGAMLLQTLAYALIAGRSAADGIMLSGISLLLIGLLPEGHPLIHGPFFDSVRPWIIGAGAVLLLAGLLVLALSRRGRY